MVLDVTHRFELKQLLLLNADSEARIGLDKNLIKAKRIYSDVFHQAGIGRDDRRICAGNAMQDLHKASLQLLLIGSSLGQHLHHFDSAKVPVSLRLSLAPVPAELLVDGLMVNVDEKAQAIFRQA